MKTPGRYDLDVIADAVAQKLRGHLPNLPLPGNNPLPGGPAGAPDPELPNLPWDPIGEWPTEIFPRRRLVIAGVEFTQSIQYHGAAGESYGDDNSVPLVALKPLVIRVYPAVRPGFASPDALSGEYVTGEVVLSIGNRVIYRTGPTRSSGARIGPRNNLSRTLWDEELTGLMPGPSIGVLRRFELNPSLNFRIPAWYCKRGRVHVAVRIWRVSAGQMAPDSAAESQYVQFLDVRVPRIALVRVNWQDSAGTVNRPNDADMLGTLRLAERMLPFPYFETTILGIEITSSADFATSAASGGCNTAWNNLNKDLAVTRIFTALFQLGDIVFGMVPAAAIPAGAAMINSGCGGETGGCFVGFNSTFAHEMGHIYGCRHTAVAGDPNSDPNYPNYGGDKRSIGEVGIDTGTSPPTLFDPATFDDIMSYGNSQWISPYTYRKILDARGNHQSAAADPARVRPLLVLDFELWRDGRAWSRVEVRKVFRIEAAGHVSRLLDEATSPVSIDLLDGEGGILATHHCFHVPTHGNCGCSCHERVPLEREPYLSLQETIEWPGDKVASLAFHRGEEPIATFNVGKPPRVEISGPEREGNLLVLRVNAAHRREKPSVVLLYTADDGINWLPVAFDPPEVVQVDPTYLSGGEKCRFRVVATAEFQMAIAETEMFEQAPSPRRLHVVTPPENCGIPPGAVALRALIDTRGLGAIGPQEIIWRSNIDGELGAGFDLVADLSEGRHELVVTAPDGIGGTLSERAIIIVGGRPLGGQSL